MREGPRNWGKKITNTLGAGVVLGKVLTGIPAEAGPSKVAGAETQIPPRAEAQKISQDILNPALIPDAELQDKMDNMKRTYESPNFTNEQFFQFLGDGQEIADSFWRGKRAGMKVFEFSAVGKKSREHDHKNLREPAGLSRNSADTSNMFTMLFAPDLNGKDARVLSMASGHDQPGWSREYKISGDVAAKSLGRAEPGSEYPDFVAIAMQEGMHQLGITVGPSSAGNDQFVGYVFDPKKALDRGFFHFDFSQVDSKLKHIDFDDIMKNGEVFCKVLPSGVSTETNPLAYRSGTMELIIKEGKPRIFGSQMIQATITEGKKPDGAAPKSFKILCFGGPGIIQKAGELAIAAGN
ncbi:hypothetical protein HY968_03660 [Candidatus Kaiserbacteria bacterium]|nr:hypothetical protein [Candidatus Kaiserbacteria bacterium]